MEDLWPEDIGQVKMKSPVAILREQASLLGPKTQNLVEAEVETWREAREGSFGYIFYLVAPALSRYRYKLLGIYHDILLYPVEVVIETEIMQEISPETENVVMAESESEFLEILRKIFGARKTRQLIHALLAQIEPGWEEEEIPF